MTHNQWLIILFLKIMFNVDYKLCLLEDEHIFRNKYLELIRHNHISYLTRSSTLYVNTYLTYVNILFIMKYGEII